MVVLILPGYKFDAHRLVFVGLDVYFGRLSGQITAEFRRESNSDSMHGTIRILDGEFELMNCVYDANIQINCFWL